mmetsp:Transcript_30718/g.82378  ORF Transcript_30718/g.82378 Transcript_30718/m.82378 type:complete len:345 (+) Transcript_30718:51-1085(+)
MMGRHSHMRHETGRKLVVAILSCSAIVGVEGCVGNTVIHNLRSDDTRLVRPSPSLHTAEQQERYRADGTLEEMIECTLRQPSWTDMGLSKKLRILEAITLFTTDSMENRQLLGRLVEFVDTMLTDDTGRVQALAAESAWILVFNHPGNHAALAERGVTKLQHILKHSRNSAARMWAAAALQNLAASYCNGRCAWGWQEGRLLITPESGSLTIDSSEVRKAIASDHDLLAIVPQLLCSAPRVRGSVGPANGHYQQQENDNQMIPWAVAGLVKNLALSQELHEQIISPRLVKCLCDLATESEDWLESSKSSAALHHLGLTCDEGSTCAAGGGACVEGSTSAADGEL